MNQKVLLPPPLPASYTAKLTAATSKSADMPPAFFESRKPAIPPPLPATSLQSPPFAANVTALSGNKSLEPDNFGSTHQESVTATFSPLASPAPVTPKQIATVSRKGFVLKAVISGVAIVMLGSAAVGTYFWRERSAEETRLVTAAAEKLKAQAQDQVRQEELQRADLEAQAQIEIARFQAEKQRSAEATLAMSSGADVSGKVGATPAVDSTLVSLPKLLLTDDVLPAESQRRATIYRKLEAERLAAESHLRNLPVSRIFDKAGISAASVTASVASIQSAVLAALDGKIPETQLVAIDNLPKPARGNRKDARRTNEEGLTLMQANRFQEAATSFSRAIEQDPADAEVLGNLSYAYLKNGQLEESILVSDYAVRLSPRRGGTWNQFAAAYARQGANWLAVRAYFVLYSLSGDQTKTRDFLMRTSSEDGDERVREAARLTLMLIPAPVSR